MTRVRLFTPKINWNILFDTAKRHGGKQALYTPEGYVVPMHVRNGLFYIDMQPPSDHDMLQYPHTFITADHEWDPSILDDEYHHCWSEEMVRRG